MANLDKLLRKIEQNKENAEKTTNHEIVIDGETFTVRTLTRREKNDYLYSQEVGKKTMTVGDYIKKVKPFIYRSLPELKDLAVKAQEGGLIKSYYDVIDSTFEADEVMTLVNFIEKINNINDGGIEEVEELKKP